MCCLFKSREVLLLLTVIDGNVVWAAGNQSEE